jgi:hypothetical protein
MSIFGLQEKQHGHGQGKMGGETKGQERQEFILHAAKIYLIAENVCHPKMNEFIFPGNVRQKNCRQKIHSITFCLS